MWAYEKGVLSMPDFSGMLTNDYKTIRTREEVEDPKTGERENVVYIQEYIGYDTETSSWRVDPSCGKIYSQNFIEHMTKELREEMHSRTVPRACVYAWMIAIRGKAVLVRSWEEFMLCVGMLCDHYNTAINRRLVIYVHNLPYEFQFMAWRFEWHDVFSVGDRSVIRAITKSGIEFRDSLILSKMPLEKVAEQLTETYGIKIEKLVGELDYQKIRHTKTPLSEQEKEYCGNDVKILTIYIYIKCKEDGDITKIPMTDTGYVRQDTREMCLRVPADKARPVVNPKTGKTRYDYVNRDFVSTIRALTLTVDDYNQCKRAFAGGDTHANPYYVDVTLHDVHSNDETSAYPTMQLAKKYPMSALSLEPSIQTIEDVRRWRDAGYWVQYDVMMWDVMSCFKWHQTISESKCRIPDAAARVIDNGRIVSCQYLETTMTAVDDILFPYFYKCRKIRIKNARVARMDYLPREIIEAILKFYQGKCTLKGVESKVVEYTKLKGELNSEYGMMVMDIVRQLCAYKNGKGWEFENVQCQSVETVEATLEKYNKSKRRFTYYPHGVAVTAWARHSLRLAILELGPDFVYCDTDSVKYLNFEKHQAFFATYNKMITDEVNACLDNYGIDRALACPVNEVSGESQPIGVWDYEGRYRTFKTLGAKRYLVEKVDKKASKEAGETVWKLEATVAGCNKKKLSSYLDSFENPFEVFDIGTLVPHRACGRMISTYIDPVVNDDGSVCGYGGMIEDYLGNVAPWAELSFVSLEPSDYLLSRSDDFEAFLQDITD